MGKPKKPFPKKKASTWKSIIKKYSDLNRLNNLCRNICLDTKYTFYVAIVLFVAELCLCIGIVERVKYTEIDWKAYMQEVEGFLNGTYDYSKLKGDTGPLVYPAGFVYIYSILYYVTNMGTNIRLAQYIFIGLYLLTIACVMRLYIISKKVPPYVLAIMCFTTYRIHSIYLLRLFNDPFASFFVYLAINFFTSGYWSIGSLIYSLAVSVKMNALLFAPALLVAYYMSLGVVGTLVQLFICGIVQLVFALPFLLENPLSYLMGAFDFGRVFLYQWTVNWRFIPEEIFVSRSFHLALLGVHLLLLLLFSKIVFKFLRSFSSLLVIQKSVNRQLKHRQETIDMGQCSQLLLLPMFLVNLIGVACSRSLHYQFYVWYYHTLPYLAWCTSLPVRYKLAVLGFIEMAWNVYPSTEWSSALLHGCHITLLYNLYVHNTKIYKDSNI